MSPKSNNQYIQLQTFYTSYENVKIQYNKFLELHFEGLINNKNGLRSQSNKTYTYE